MKNYFLFFGVLVLCMFSVFALPICIDHDEPYWEGSADLSFSSSGTTITLSWDSAIDKPVDCGEVSYYEIYRDSVFIANTSSTSYSDDVSSYGTYSYTIHAFDLIGHESVGLSKSVTISSGGTNTNGGSGGGRDDDSGGSSVHWNCSEWSECNGTQTRFCTSLDDSDNTMTETRFCTYLEKTSFENSDFDENGQSIADMGNADDNNGFVSSITGAAIGVVKEPVKYAWFWVIILVALFVLYRVLRWKRRVPKKKIDPTKEMKEDVVSEAPDKKELENEEKVDDTKKDNLEESEK